MKTSRPTTTNTTSTSLLTLLRLDESKADKVKAALIAKYPEDKEALSKVFAANMLGPSLWFPAMEMWSARKSEPVEETIAALTSYVKNRDKLGDVSQYKTTAADPDRALVPQIVDNLLFLRQNVTSPC